MASKSYTPKRTVADAAERERLNRGLLRAVRQAGRVILEIYATDFSRRDKSDGSPVTEADVAGEKVILAALAKLAPGVPVISEENECSHDARCGGRFFLVDPIDGTKEFIAKNGEFTINIGYVENGKPVLGVVYAPALDELYYVDANGTAWRMLGRSRRKIAVRVSGKGGRLALISRSHMDAETRSLLDRLGVAECCPLGSSLKFCRIAAGKADVYARCGGTHEWDTAAADAVLRAAGGMLMTCDGEPMPYGKPGFKNPAYIALGRTEASLS